MCISGASVFDDWLDVLNIGVHSFDVYKADKFIHSLLNYNHRAHGARRYATANTTYSMANNNKINIRQYVIALALDCC